MLLLIKREIYSDVKHPYIYLKRILNRHFCCKIAQLIYFKFLSKNIKGKKSKLQH